MARAMDKCVGWIVRHVCVVALCLIGLLATGLLLAVCGSCRPATAPAQVGLAVALETAVRVIDEAERVEGNAAIDRAATREEAERELARIRAKWQPVWRALAAAAAAELAALRGEGSEQAALEAWCALRRTAPYLSLVGPDCG